MMKIWNHTKSDPKKISQYSSQRIFENYFGDEVERFYFLNEVKKYVKILK